MKNDLVINLLTNVGDILEILGESVYKIRAYRKAVEALKEITEDVENLVKEKKIEDVPGIGEAIGGKIKEIVETGKLYYLDKLLKQIPLEVTSLMKIEGIGGKTAGRLYHELGIKSIKGLEEAIGNGLLLSLPGFTEAKVAKIANALKSVKSEQKPLPNIEQHAFKISDFLVNTNLLLKVDIGGSFRRKKSTVRDLDIHAVGDPANFEQVMKLFTEMTEVSEVIVTGSSKSTVKLVNDLNVDLRLLEENSYGAGLLYSTGSRAHTIKLRTICDKKNLTLNEYGLFKEKNDELIASLTETEIYKAMGMSFIPPELREDRGEIEAAMSNSLPRLITREDIMGDLHIHTNWSDGKASLKEMITAADNSSLEYIAITDHVGKIPIYRPLNKTRFNEQKKELENLVSDFEIKILHGIEVDITKEGKIDAPKEMLIEAEFVIASIHSLFDLSEEEMTQRILTAMDNEYINAIGHPTGRMFEKREGYNLNFSKIVEKGKETNTFLEINAQPNRQDIDDYIVFDIRVKLPVYIGTDAHYTKDLENITWGINIARRGWCEKKHLLNCLGYKELLRKLKH
ncbi:MAG TPA: DNA polymerase/3'-5' exonuclease PolX [Candidatus Bathyarchaeia archaeon]|nr:DNA polymerase/3'-5' exonuclease PolX [Candidatus Bathyarchaeia archaeon]